MCQVNKLALTEECIKSLICTQQEIGTEKKSNYRHVFLTPYYISGDNETILCMYDSDSSTLENKIKYTSRIIPYQLRTFTKLELSEPLPR